MSQEDGIGVEEKVDSLRIEFRDHVAEDVDMRQQVTATAESVGRINKALWGEDGLGGLVRDVSKLTFVAKFGVWAATVIGTAILLALLRMTLVGIPIH